MGAAEDVAARMRDDLRGALRARDRATTSALRCGLAAIANAEAPPAVAASASPLGGSGATEVDRLVLTADEVAAVLRREAEDRRATAATVRQHGRDAEAGDLEREAAVLERYAT